MKTLFIPIDYDYFDFKGRNYARIIGRNDKGRQICIIDSCDVYLWAILESNLNQKKIDSLIKKIENICIEVKGRKTKVEKVELHRKKFLEKEVKALKIFVTNYKDLHDIANKLNLPGIEKIRGYDLGYITHYIIEKNLLPLKWHEIEGELLSNSNDFGGIDMAFQVYQVIKLEKIKNLDKDLEFKPKVLTYDIECDEIKIGEGEILMISLFCGQDNFKKVITWKKTQNNKKPAYVEYVKDEAELIEKFVDYTKKISPDFLVGYYSDGFDLPYLKSRASKFNVKLSLGLDDSQPIFSGGVEPRGKISGIVHVDLLKFIRTAYAQYMQSETLSLDDVAQEFLGEQKKDFVLKHSSKILDHEWEKYYEYNLHDSKLVYNLFIKFWPDLLEFSRILHEPIFEVSRFGLSKYVESYILHNLNKFNEIPEKRPVYSEINERRNAESVEGAFVYPTNPGIYENIVIFDFTSMHTSIMITHNISKSTLLKEKVKDCFESPELTFKGKKTKFYFSKKLGFIPQIVQELFEKRKKFKEEYKKNPNVLTKARSNAFKVLSASIHGYIGFFGARYYSLESSASILAFVRKYNLETIEKIKNLGYKIIFGDTDSVGFLIGDKNEKEIFNLLEKLNSELPGVMQIEIENFYKRGIWVTTRAGVQGAKKKYALMDKKGDFKIRGFETVRRDWCYLSREVQDNVLRQILKDGNEKKSLEYIKKIIKKLKQREIALEELIIRTQLKKSISDYKAITPHVIAAKKMEQLQIPITQGNLIEYYIAETPGKEKLVREKVKLPIEKGQYDIGYYLNHQLLPAIENIFQVFNINVKEIIDGNKQKTLF